MFTQTATSAFGDFCVWRDLRGTFYVSDNEAADPIEIGTLLDVIDYIEEMAKEEE